MLNFSSSPLPFTPASAVSFIAGGPIGVNIIADRSIGSSLNQRVFAASAQISIFRYQAGSRENRCSPY